MLNMSAARAPLLPSPMMSTLPINGAKARYGVSYLESICSAAGVPITESRPDADVRAVDCSIAFPQGDVFVQVKCSAMKVSPKAQTVRWQLEDHWIEKWSHFRVPVYFLLVRVRREPAWIDHQSAATLHHAHALWQRIDTDLLDKSISIPVSNQFSADTLKTWHNDLLAGHGARNWSA